MHPSPLLRLAVIASALGLSACGSATRSTLSADNQTCTACHGDASRAGTVLQQAAPPIDAHGNTDRTVVTVGAHQAHVYGGIACETCHHVPAIGDPTHFASPVARVAFSGSLVGAGNTPVAAWDPALHTCANYCHTGVNRGAGLPNPSWTQTAPLDCGSCHWNQQTALTSTGLHQFHTQDLPSATRLVCSACHGVGYAAGSVTASTHVDGTIQLLTLVGWQDPQCAGPRTCYATCHQVQACRNWP